jgi:flagellar motor switch/type III secretory pathway protein FliN
MAAAQAIEKAPAEAAQVTAPRAIAWNTVSELGCRLTVDLPIPDFKVGDLLRLREGSVMNARWKLDSDVPLFLNGTQIGWIEFEVVNDNLAVRLTELA